jgi:hypothetical protein
MIVFIQKIIKFVVLEQGTRNNASSSADFAIA